MNPADNLALTLAALAFHQFDVEIRSTNRADTHVGRPLALAIRIGARPPRVDDDGRTSRGPAVAYVDALQLTPFDQLVLLRDVSGALLVKIWNAAEAVDRSAATAARKTLQIWTA